jgi:hypothetical protein
MIDTGAIRLRWEADGSKRDERGKRVFAASEARAAGWGGVAAVAEITGLARSRIIRGLKDLNGPALEPGRIRRAGGGRHRVTATDSTLLGELKRLVEPATMGDPMRPLTWVSKSREKLACELNASGHAVSPNTIGRLLVDELKYSRQVNRKTLEGAEIVDRLNQEINAGLAGPCAAHRLGRHRACRLARRFRQAHHGGSREVAKVVNFGRETTQPGHRVFDDARENPTGVTVKRVARVLFEPSDAVLLLEIVHGRGQRARCFPAEHLQMHQRLRIEFARLQPPDLRATGRSAMPRS